MFNDKFIQSTSLSFNYIKNNYLKNKTKYFYAQIIVEIFELKKNEKYTHLSYCFFFY